jgi:hypothetical protein
MSLVLVIVGQIQQQYENVHCADSLIHMKGMNPHLTNEGSMFYPVARANSCY